MGITGSLLKNIMWRFAKKRLGYNDEQMKLFRENPRNEDVLSKAPILMSKRIIVEVVDSQGCNSQHMRGDKFYFDGVGNLLTGLCQKKICIYALHAVTPQIFCANELIYAGVDPNDMRFKRAACFDVGVECGGFGRVVMEVRVEDRQM